MSKALYTSINGMTRKCRKMYAVRSGTNRKIKKGYCVVGGVTHKFFGGELRYYGQATELPEIKYKHGAAANENYAIFAGGHDRQYTVKTVYAYNKMLVQSQAADLSSVRQEMGAERAGEYAIFAGGFGQAYSVPSQAFSKVEAYNQVLTKSTGSSLSNSKYDIGSAHVGDYAIFAG